MKVKPYLQTLFPTLGPKRRLQRDADKFIREATPYIDLIFPDGIPAKFADHAGEDWADLRLVAQSYGIRMKILADWTSTSQANAYARADSESPVTRARIRMAIIATLFARDMHDEAVKELKILAHNPLWPYLTSGFTHYGGERKKSHGR